MTFRLFQSDLTQVSARQLREWIEFVNDVRRQLSLTHDQLLDGRRRATVRAYLNLLNMEYVRLWDEYMSRL